MIDPAWPRFEVRRHRYLAFGRDANRRRGERMGSAPALLRILSLALLAGLLPRAEAVPRHAAECESETAQVTTEQPGTPTSQPSSQAAPPRSLDYRQLRDSLNAERSGARPQSDKILGLPTDDFYAPATPSGVKTVWNSPLLFKAIEKYANSVKLNQGGAIWLFVVVLGIVGFDWNRLVSWHNVDIVILPLLCFFLVDLISVGENPDEPGRRTLAGLMFAGIFLISSYWLVRCLVGAFRRPGPPRAPALRLAALVPLTLLCVADGSGRHGSTREEG